MIHATEAELTQPVDVSDHASRLVDAAVGWSRTPLQRMKLGGPWGRRKRWTYWAVMSPDVYVSVAVVNLDYVASAFVFVADFKAQQVYERQVVLPLGKGVNLSESVHADVQGRAKDFEVQILALETGTRLLAEVGGVDGRSLSLDVMSPATSQESLNVVIPWSPKRFHYTQKQVGLPVSGRLKLADKTDMQTWSFEDESCWAVHDHGHGIWPYSSRWQWCIGYGNVEGHKVGLNLGAIWTDGTGMTENALFVDGKIQKLASPITVKDHGPAQQKVLSADGRIDLVFTFDLARAETTNLGLVASSMDQTFGTYEGTLSLEDGTSLTVTGMPGTIEHHTARW